ncbi:MAG: EscU/YscU/HrcU family type III secretion system export apparatus switch protein [Thermoguttaceae bacterium]
MSEQEKTIQATPQKRQKERKKGNVPISHDLVAALSFCVGAFVLLTSARTAATRGAAFFSDALGAEYVLQMDVEQFVAKILALTFSVLKHCLSLFLAVVASVVATTLLQTRGLFLIKKAAPDFTRLSPAKYVKRLFSGETIFQACLGLGKTFLYIGLIALAIYRDAKTLVSLPFGDLPNILLFSFQFFSRLIYQLCALSLILAACDYAWKRWEYEKNLRMTVQEFREELREESGSPQAKGAQRAARQSLMGAVTEITSPAPPRPISPFKTDDSKKQTHNEEKKDKPTTRRR